MNKRGPKDQIEMERFRELNTPFYGPLNMFCTELHMLRELNKRLAKSIVEMQASELLIVRRKGGKLSDKDKQEVMKLSREVLIYLQQKKVRASQRKFVWKGAFAIVHPPRFIDFMRNMSLVYLVSMFENFLEQITNIVLRERPETLKGIGKSVPVEELIGCRDIESVRQRLRAKATESFLQGDIQEIDDRLQQKWGISFSQFGEWRMFKERFYRRNAIVHHSGTVDTTYRMKTGYRGKVDKLSVSEKYLVESIYLFENMGVDLATAFHAKFLTAR